MKPSDNTGQVANLTQSQLLLWAGQELNPEAPLYNMVLTFELKGAIDTQHFCLAFQALLDQSDAMRTVFQTSDGIPIQRVVQQLPFTLKLFDWSEEPTVDVLLQNWVSEQSQQLLDLSKRAFDSALIKLASDRYVWYLNQHHLITDAWSVSVQYRTLSELYHRSLEGSLKSAPPLPFFQDYVRYEQVSQSSERSKETSAYWAGKVVDPPSVPRLYGHTGQVTGTRSDRVSLDLGVERSNHLRTLTEAPDLRAWTQHLSLYNIFATVLFAYLYRVTGQRRLSIGTPAHNRPTAVFKETPGVFIELFPLFTEIEEGQNFSTLLQQNRDEVNGFLRYAQPGATSATLNRNFYAILNYIHAAFTDFNGIPQRSEWVHPDHCDPRHHLRLQVHDFDASGSIQLHFDLNREVFEESLCTTAPQHFLALLDAFIKDRNQPIGQPILLDNNELKHTIYRLNETTVAFDDQTVIDLFAVKVADFKNAPALHFQGQSLSYLELDQKSNQLAHYLIAQGVVPGQTVALYLKRSPEFMIGLWGVLKTGAAFIPIASNSPKERVIEIFTDANASIALTLEKLKANCEGAISFCMDANWRQIESQPVEPPEVEVFPNNLAYIMYTSGSTGRPKGVMISHRALANYILWAKNSYVTDQMVFPLFTMVAFDLTITSIFVPLVSGGSVVIYEENDYGPDLALEQVMEDDLIDVMKLTPAHLTLLRDKDLSSSRIKILIVGGENFKSQLAQDILDAFGPKEVHIYNEYGPTEATVGCIVHQLKPSDTRLRSVPIGTPIANMQAYVLDTYHHPVPQGVVGELYLSGTGLAEGYLNKVELTSKKFVTNPFLEGKKMYSTGDLVRLNSQDQLEYLGREDEQVKIGGIRVELGEIESVLNNHPDITHCVVDLQVPKKQQTAAEIINCTRCGLPSNYPSIDFDENNVCQLCRSFENYQQKAQQYFRNRKELQAIFDRAKTRKKGSYDCIALLSGGKDSTYALAQLVEMDLKVLSFTLDNGYISDQAKANIRRVVNELGVDHVFGETPAMNEIFVDSLQRHCNVCNGCFKTIYTLSTKLALEKGIPIIVTGLSRGQFFETRLTEELFRDENVDFEGIDETILEARKAYHRTDDAVNRLLDVSIFEDDRVFEKVEFVDFYRYSDVSLDQMLAYLDTRLPWVRPTDTGRSTNCLINQLGIHVHTKERGYSNYAFPYSWDVRVGHKNREASLEEINEEIDVQAAERIMREIGYRQPDDSSERPRLVSYYVGTADVSQADLRAYLALHLPAYMIPTHFRVIPEIPLTENGKIDRKSLPSFEGGRPDLGIIYEPPRSQVEEMLAEIWSQVLQVPQVGVHDNFLQLGGNSLAAIRLMARINEAFMLDLPLSRVFEFPTIAEFGRLIAETIKSLLGD